MQQGVRERPIGVVMNPSSALGRGRLVAARVLEALRDAGEPAVEVAGRDAAGCQAAVREACAAGLRALVLVGGDGLLGLVLQLPEARALPLGLIPAGSGNDFARQFGLDRHPARAVRRILQAESGPRPVDLGVVTLPGGREHWFAGGLSVGFDAAVNRRANAIRLPLGPFRYYLALLAELATLRSRPFRVELPGHDSDGDADRDGATSRDFIGLLATAMNTRTIGGGIPLAPRASAEDGALDLVEVTHGGKLRILSVLGVLARGRHERLPEVRITRVQRVRISAGDEVAYADGERVGAGPFDVRVAPAAIRLLG